MRVAILGATGLIGRALHKKLTELSIECVGTTSRETTSDSNSLFFINATEIPRFLEKVRCDVVVNCISRGLVSGTSSIEEMREANVDLPDLVAQSVRNLGEGCRLIHLASAIEPIKGNLPESEYASTKREGSDRVRSHLEGSGISFSIARLHNVYSNELTPQKFISLVVEAARARRTFLVNWPNRIRDFSLLSEVVTHLSDLIIAKSFVSNELEIGSMVGISLREVTTLIYDEIGAPLNLIAENSFPAIDPNPIVVAGMGDTFTLKCQTAPSEGLRELLGNLV